MYSYSAHISTESIHGLGIKHEELGQSSLIRISLNACIGPLYTGFANNDICSGGLVTNSINLISARARTVCT